MAVMKPVRMFAFVCAALVALPQRACAFERPGAAEADGGNAGLEALLQQSGLGNLDNDQMREAMQAMMGSGMGGLGAGMEGLGKMMKVRGDLPDSCAKSRYRARESKPDHRTNPPGGTRMLSVARRT